MASSAPEFDATAGHDSLLDVVTNIVGIMILLVMIAGSRLKQHAEQKAVAPDPQAAARVTERQSQLEQQEQELTHLETQLNQVKRLYDVRQVERLNYLTAHQLAAEQLSKLEGALAAKDQTELALKQELSQIQKSLQQASAKRAELGIPTVEEEVIELSNRPTPIASTVFGDEIHLHLQGSKVAYVPVAELVNEFKREALERMKQGRIFASSTGEVGPIDGFRLKYQLSSKRIMGDMGELGQSVELERWELIPAETLISDPIEVALKPNSRFRKNLAKAARGRVTITVWTYPDSFQAYRKLTEQLHAEGLTVAARPLPPEVFISGSPRGTRSSSQ